MKDGLLETQLIMPSLNTEATLTATMNCAEDLTLELKSNIKLPETNTVQRFTLQYGISYFSCHCLHSLFILKYLFIQIGLK